MYRQIYTFQNTQTHPVAFLLFLLFELMLV